MVFISYSSKEYELASRLRSILSDNNIDCWMAPESIPAGGDYSNEIPKAIANSDMFMVIVSENSQHSTYVPKELDTAIASKKIVIPIRIDSHKLENAFKFWLTNIQCIDAMNGLENACEQIVNRIRHAKQIPNASDISSDLPERISFYELLDVTDSREIDIQKMRDKADVTKALAVPIARNDQGESVYLGIYRADCIFSQQRRMRYSLSN